MGSSGKDDSALLEAAHALTKEDIEQLVTELAVKDDDTRYRLFYCCKANLRSLQMSIRIGIPSRAS